jgi:hypothetical protein
MKIIKIIKIIKNKIINRTKIIKKLKFSKINQKITFSSKFYQN